ncbi:MAG: MFS transporter [Anaerolineales bacterium]|nr:MFS transporter [Anaerolineales bacterium]
MKKRPFDAYKIYLIMTAAEWLIFSLFITVDSVYRATNVTDDPLQLTLIFTVFTATILVFEIPTGVVADVYSRRLSVIIGFVLMGIGAIIEGVLPVFGWVLLAQVVWGIGFTFISGARDAWIADEIGQERVGKAYMRGTQISQITSLIAIPISTLLGVVALNVPIVLSGALFLLLALFLVIFMPEEGFHPHPREERESWHAMIGTFRDGIRLVRASTMLLAMFVISAVYGLSALGFDNLWTLNMLENVPFPLFWNLEPVVWFGVLNGIVSVLGLIGTEIVHRKIDISSQAVIVRTMMLLTGGTALCMMIFGLTGNFILAGTAYCLSLAFRTTSDPILKTWVNMNTETNVRATVISMEEQVFSLGELVGGPLIGIIGSTISLKVALFITGLVRAPVAVLFGRLVLLGKKSDIDKLKDTLEP